MIKYKLYGLHYTNEHPYKYFVNSQLNNQDCVICKLYFVQEEGLTFLKEDCVTMSDKNNPLCTSHYLEFCNKHLEQIRA